MSDIERELEAELHRVLDPLSSLPIPSRRAVRSRGPIKTLLGSAGAALTIKILSGVAVAAAAITVAGAATTGSLDPTVWGQQVKQQVDTCKDQLAQGQHGIGDCVSPFSNQHGQTVASNARHHGIGNGDGSPNSQGNGNGHGKDKSRETPAPPFTGEPTDPSTHPPARITPGP